MQKTADNLMRGFAELLKPAGLSPTQYNVLRILRGTGAEGLACQHIARRMLTRDPDVTRLLDRLEDRGLIARQRQSEDRRVIKVRLADTGAELLATLDQPVAEMHLRQLSHLGPERLRELADLLDAARKENR